MVRLRPSVFALLSLSLVLVGCGGKPPAPPFVDPVTSPTSLIQQDITGYAKFGSTVTVEGGAATATTTADPYVGRFRVTVMLAPMTTNTLSVTAKNGSGVSNPTIVTIVTPAPADRITLDLSNPTMRAGGSVTAKVKVYDVNGMSTAMLVAPAVAGPTGAGAVTVSGTGTATDPFKLSGTLAGVYTVTASLSADKTASASLTVIPADATMAPDLHVRLASAPQGADVTNVTAGTELVYRYSVVDQYGNAIPLPNVTVSTNMLGAVVGPVDTQDAGSGNTIYQGPILNFVRSGTFAISAHLAGTSLTQSRMITVGTDTAALVAHLTLSNNITQVGNPLSYKVVVLDEFGNVDTASLSRLSLSFTPPPTNAPACSPTACDTAAAIGTINFSDAGSFQVSATFSGTPTVISDSLFVSVINAPVPPTLTIFDPKATDIFAPGDTVSIRIQSHTASTGGGTASFIASGQFTDSGTVTVGRDVCAAGSLNCAPIFTFNVPGGVTYGTESVLVVVTDGTTGASLTKSVTFTVDPARRIVANGGRIVTVVARGGRLNTPMGLTTYGTSDLYIANNGNNEVLKVNLAGPLPVLPNVSNIFTSGVANASDVQLRPNAAALLIYPPVAFQGLYVANDGGGIPLRTTDSAGNPTGFSTFLDITSTAYQAIPVPGTGGNVSRLFAADFANNRVQVLDPVSGADLSGGGLAFGLNNPWGVTFFPQAGSTKVVADNDGDDRIRSCDLGTGAPATWIANCAANQRSIASRASGASLRRPRALAIGPTSGKVYAISQRGPRAVLMYDQASPLCATNGTCPESVIVSGFDTPNGLAFDSAGNMYVSDEATNLVVRIAPNGNPF